MKTRSWILRLTILSLVAGSLASPPAAAPRLDGAASTGIAYAAAKLEPAVWTALQASPGGMAEAVVYLEAQADLSFAEGIDDWNARGWAVYDALRATADRSQVPVLQALARSQRDGHVGDYQSFWIENLVIVHADREGLLAAAALPEVAAVLAPPDMEFDAPVPGDPEPAGLAAVPDAPEWNLLMVRANEVWATYGVTGTGAVVANIDTGVEYSHTALIRQYRGNLGGGVFDHNYNWFDLQGSQWPQPVGTLDFQHGTHTMGTMVGDDGAGNQIGLAPGARWMAASGGAEWYSYAISLAALQWVVAPARLDGTNPDPSKRPDVVSHSWFGKPNGTLNYEKGHDALRASGIFMANSAGNTGAACATVNSPNNNPGSFNVGATTSTDAIASFSARGPNAFNPGTSPHISAPGNNVRSSIPGNSYAQFSGTSMSAPHASGAAALLISLEPKLRGQVAQMRELLRRTADAKTSTQTCGGVPGSQVPNNTFGWGRLNVKAAADMIHDAGWLSGTVTAGGVPVRDALVTFSKTAYTYTLTTRTDAAGRYQVLAGAGTWNMTAGGFGFVTMNAAGLTVTENAVTVQDFALTALPSYTVSGVIRDAATSAGVAAYLEIEGYEDAHPGWAAANGNYALVLPQGTYTLTVSHPGYDPQAVGLVINGNTTRNVDLTARINYACLDSRDPGGPVYNWIEASDGTAHNMTDNSAFQLNLPVTYTYFGAPFTRVWVGSDGNLQFNSSALTAYPALYLFLPFERTPNNDVMVLGDNLDPAGSAQGVVYDKNVGGKTVIQWQAVQHVGGGYPETFQAILDPADNSITVQYKELSWTAFTSAGLENAAGTAGQLWSYMDSAHLANGLAVKYTPTSGNGANWGCDHVLWLENNPTVGVIDAPGGEVTFRVNGNVFGPFGAPGVVVSATVPLGTELVATSPGATVNGRVITWDVFGNARTKATVSVWYTLRAQALWPGGTVIRSLATISDASGQWRQDYGFVRVRRTGLPENSILLPAVMR